MAAGVKSLSKTFVWILMGLLIVGLMGFGAVNLSGTARTVATVGNQTVSVDDYFRELQREIRAVEAQSGQPLQMAQARAMGLDQRALSQLIALASLDSETQDLGISIGDKNLQKEITAIPSFQGINGAFDPETYRFTLEQNNIDVTEFEDDIRRESARTIVQGAIMSGVQMPLAASDAMMEYVGARRSFTMATLTAADLDAPIPTATDEDLRAFYEANSDTFTLPQTKRITYAVLRPDALLDEVEVDAEAVKRLYDERSAQFNVPERRLVERLVLEDDDAAASAKAQLEVGGTTFDQLVQDRNLSLADVDMGDVSAADLGDAAEAVFAAEINDVVGPLPSPFGPALYRINGTLAAQSTPFANVEQELRDELAGERARRLIEAQAEDIEDLLAGGATPEDLAKETEMELAQIDWSVDSADGIAAYDAFRQAASEVTLEDFPTVMFLEDGGIFAMQLDDVLPARPEPFADAIDRVRIGWELEQTAAALRTRADAVMNELTTSNDFGATGLPTRVENGLTRTAYLEGTPPDFMTQIFEMNDAEMRVIGSGDTMYVVRLDGTQPPEDSPEMNQMRDALAQQLDQALAQALFETFVRDAQLRAQPTLDQRAVNAVQSSFQ